MSANKSRWQASEARANFPEVMKRALSGSPQIVHHRNGDEVVILSKANYNSLQPTLAEFLLRGGSCGDDDEELEQIIARGRADGITLMGRLPVKDP